MKITLTVELNKVETQWIVYMVKQRLPDELWEMIKDQTVNISIDDLGDQVFYMKTSLLGLALQKIGIDNKGEK